MNFCIGFSNKLFTAWPAAADLDPEIGGYRIPQGYPFDGQHRSSPVWHEFCEKTAGVTPEETGEIIAEGFAGF